MNAYLNVKDHAVSKEDFELWEDPGYGLLKTLPVPPDLGRYYQSEDYISHTDGRRSLFERAYQLVKRHTISRKEKLIRGCLKRPGNLLDIGAGTGDFLAYAEQKGWTATGMEPNPKARERARNKGVLLLGDTASLPDASFDVVTLWHVLEHVADLGGQLSELKRICRPNGWIVVAVPNYRSYDARHYGAFWAAFDVPRHLWHFSKTAIEKLFATKQIALQKNHPMYFDSFYVSLLSEKYKTGKTNAIKALCVGLLSNINGTFSGEFSSHVYVLKNAG